MENTKKLGIIPVYDTEDFLTTEFTENSIIINSSQESPVIQYKSGDSSWVRIDGSDSPKRSARLSDLEYFLRERDWNIGFGRKVSIPDTTRKEFPYCMLQEESYLSPIVTVSEKDFKDKSKVAVISDTFNTKETIDQFNSRYEELMNIKSTMTYNNISTNLGATHYYNLISTRDLENESTVIDLLSLCDSNYTNILNINGLISPEVGKNGNSCNLTVGINYTVNGNVYSKEILLDPVEGGETFKSKDILINILDYVIVDYHDFCLRAFPNSLDVNECIISYCYITYHGV